MTVQYFTLLDTQKWKFKDDYVPIIGARVRLHDASINIGMYYTVISVFYDPLQKTAYIEVKSEI